MNSSEASLLLSVDGHKLASLGRLEAKRLGLASDKGATSMRAAVRKIDYTPLVVKCAPLVIDYLKTEGSLDHNECFRRLGRGEAPAEIEEVVRLVHAFSIKHGEAGVGKWSRYDVQNSALHHLEQEVLHRLTLE